MENRRLAEKKYKALLVRRLAMESLTSVEEQELNTLAAAVDADGSVAEAFTLAWHCAEPSDDAAALERIQQRVLKQAQAPKSPQRVEARFNSRPSRSFRPFWALAMAAALVGGLLLWSALFYAAEPVESAGLWTTFTAEKGRRFLQLEDGTQVVLAPGAKLQYAAGFGVGHREVEVEGQFFFHVAKNEQLPFLIQGPDTETRVTGTSFNLHAASGKFLLEVATGSVEVRDLAQAHATAVLAGERLQVEAHVWAQEEIGTDQPFLWTERAWAFESAPLYEVFRAMERAKGIHIEVADSGLLACRFTGKIGAESGAEVLRMIAQAMQLELTETQTNTFFIRGRPC